VLVWTCSVGQNHLQTREPLWVRIVAIGGTPGKSGWRTETVVPLHGCPACLDVTSLKWFNACLKGFTGCAAVTSIRSPGSIMISSGASGTNLCVHTTTLPEGRVIAWAEQFSGVRGPLACTSLLQSGRTTLVPPQGVKIVSLNRCVLVRGERKPVAPPERG